VGKTVIIAIVWIVAVCVVAGILLTGLIAWFKHGGHPIILALIVGAIALTVSAIVALRKDKAAD